MRMPSPISRRQVAGTQGVARRMGSDLGGESGVDVRTAAQVWVNRRLARLLGRAFEHSMRRAGCFQRSVGRRIVAALLGIECAALSQTSHMISNEGQL